jgi:uncharacterized SAM-binding protein YcdF (DUF218 family)
MSLSFLPRALLLPPISIFLALILCWALAYWRPRLGLRLMGVCLLLMLVLGLPITSTLLFVSLESGIKLTDAVSVAQAPPAAIVILSGDTGFGEPGGAILSGARVGSLSLERLRAGAALQRREKLPILVTGGRFRSDSTSLAELMADTLVTDFATPVRWIEPRSEDTWENAKYSAAMLAKANITSVYVVTHAWHMRRALIAFRHFGITAWPAPTSLDILGTLSAEDFMPRVGAWLDSYYAIHEWAGCAYYALRS